ncbi:hypothetical protein GGU10DRAFT_115444 [Lentinula aff. detonsa]|uniref:C2H2-type domain-containing protein n=1 Tax=Lentinula aff. detonsa TaxID=2804958 RepID=A0AA38NHN1_9AGAR|nr:hypothetical protein GGU10DRAFT_115444 [Lentinula aff. detonsa]
MPRVSSKRIDESSRMCSECGIILAHQYSMPRHMKTHGVGKDQTKHKCSWAGCSFETLQRSNLNAHYRTHSNDKSQVCPECDFKACYPSSLTRHRRWIHNYVPKPRKARATQKTQSSRTTSPPSEFILDFSSSSTSSNPASASTAFTSPDSTHIADCTAGSQHSIEHETNWRCENDEFLEDSVRLPIPRPLLPAIDTAPALEGSSAIFSRSSCELPLLLGGPSFLPSPNDGQTFTSSSKGWQPQYPSQDYDACPALQHSPCELLFEPATGFEALFLPTSTPEEGFRFGYEASFLQASGSVSAWSGSTGGAGSVTNLPSLPLNGGSSWDELNVPLHF